MSKILIVEDELDIAKVIVKRLTQAGFKVAVATDAYQGVELTHKEKPDLIILDLMLPAGGGISTLRHIRESALTACTPVIILTGMKDELFKEEVLKEGVDAYLEKPYDADKLIEVIKNILINKKGER